MSSFEKRFNQEISSLKLFSEKLCDEKKSEELFALLESGQDLPDGYRQSDENKHVFYELGNRTDFSTDEILALVQVKQAKDIKIIKTCIVALAALVGISLIASVILFSSLPGMFSDLFGGFA